MFKMFADYVELDVYNKFNNNSFCVYFMIL